MDLTVPPVVRGKFLFRDVLLVDVGGELKRHPRAAEADIRRLLSGKESKDQVGHWWTAQCIHYGLPSTNDKNAAKVRLQQALNQGRLESAPPHLVDMEAQMKKEYAYALRKVKNSTRLPVQPASSEGKKRTLDSGDTQLSKKTKISLTVDGVSIDIDQSTSIAVKKQKMSRSGAKPLSSDPTKYSKTIATPRKILTAAREAETSSSWSGDPRKHPDNVFQRSKSGYEVNNQPSTSKSKPKQAKTEYANRSSVKRESITRETNVKPEPLHDYDSLYDHDYEMDTRPDMSESQLSITGVYHLSCPQLAEQAPDHADKFRLFVCVDNENGRIWAGFELAWKTGVIKIDDIAWSTQLSFGWRATDYEMNGRLRFGKGCHGEIEIGDDQQLQGVFHNLFSEPLYFHGARRPGPLWCGKSAWKFEQEWDQYPRDAYGR